LIITDIEMPKFDGYAVVQALRGYPQTRHTPIIVMSNQSVDKHRRALLDIGANACIAKPVDQQALLQEVEQQVGPISAIRN
jgi:CheY-like chemotaxis protein